MTAIGPVADCPLLVSGAVKVTFEKLLLAIHLHHYSVH